MSDRAVRLARPGDETGICRVCGDGWWATYVDLYDPLHIDRIVAEYYDAARVRAEIEDPARCDWHVAVEGGAIVGAGGGGLTAPGVGELWVLYVDPRRRGEGIGGAVLDAVTAVQRAAGAREQWVSVEPRNDLAVPFYEALGFAAVAEVPSQEPAWPGHTALRMRRSL